MKSFAIILVCLCFSMQAHCAVDHTRADGYRHGARIRERLCVVDQDGRPVANASLYIGMSKGSGRDDCSTINGTTDTNGEFVVEGRCTNFLRCQVSKRDYYTTEFRLSYLETKAIPAVKDGKWQPYDTQRRIVLKKIVAPSEMSLHNALTTVRIPKYDAWLAFDFERYDFVAPFGNGSHEDVLLWFDMRKPSPSEFHMMMRVSFTNQVYAGVYKMKKDSFSEMDTTYRADTNQCYKQEMVFEYRRGKCMPPVYDRLQKDEYLVFRTRTVVAENGKLISAHYGLICGEWNFVGPIGLRTERLLFNSRENDTNLEDGNLASYSRMCFKQREELAK